MIDKQKLLEDFNKANLVVNFEFALQEALRKTYLGEKGFDFIKFIDSKIDEYDEGFIIFEYDGKTYKVEVYGSSYGNEVELKRGTLKEVSLKTKQVQFYE